jgi:hypothetical protein
LSRERRILLLGNEYDGLRQRLFRFLGEKGLDIQIREGYDLVRECEEFDIVVVNSSFFSGIERINTLLRLITCCRQALIIEDGGEKIAFSNEPWSEKVHYFKKPYSMDSLVSEIANIYENTDLSTLPAGLRFEELIRFCQNQSRDLILEISNQNNQGRIYFENGRAVHAKTEDQFGNKAFYQMQFWHLSSYQITELNTYVIHSLNDHVAAASSLFSSCNQKEQKSSDD